MLTHDGPGEPNHNGSILDAERLSVLRGLGPDDGWGILPLVVDAFLQDCPTILAGMRHAAETGDIRRFGESAHQLKGAAANIGAVNVAALCSQAENTASGTAARDKELLDQLEVELGRATLLLRETLSVAS